MPLKFEWEDFNHTPMTARPSRRGHKASPMKASNGHYGKLMAQMSRKEFQRVEPPLKRRLKLKDVPILGTENISGGIYRTICNHGS
ncbi:hypothetical protein NPIL_437371 [Nephila pilipes]|uniref:Uncharacterized protein n=1 Tax=Nephila pilipes TaxID=299642 RepID=A0A8X6Q5A6_NEPPI|nr:hypothetical protein NPIL_437371 [Nephila pilipes]